MAELVSSILETRKLLLKNDNYKKIVIDAGSNVVTVESYDGLKLYLKGDDGDEVELLEEIEEEDDDDVVMEEEEVEEIEEEDDDDVIKEVSVQKRKIRVKSEVEEIEEEDDDNVIKEEEVEEIEEEEAKELRLEENEQITDHILNMGKDLHTLIQNIDKVPNPLPQTILNTQPKSIDQ